MRILLVEDDLELAAWLSRLLQRDNYAIDCVGRGEDADAALIACDYALVILDLSLPDISGIEVLRRMRARKAATPVLILTANDAVSSRVLGLDSGADDYVIKPFAVDELEARLRTLLRRARGGTAGRMHLGQMAFDDVTREFFVRDEQLPLTKRERATLEALFLRAGRPVSKAALLETVFGFDEEPNPNTVEIYVHRVRRKLEGSGVSIATMRGLGYVLRQTDAG